MLPFSEIFIEGVPSSVAMEDHQEEVEEEHRLQDHHMEEQQQLLAEQNTNSNVTL